MPAYRRRKGKKMSDESYRSTSETPETPDTPDIKEETAAFASLNHNAPCEMLSEDNSYLFSGLIGDPSPSGAELRVELRRGDEIPEEVKENSLAKLICIDHEKDELTVLEGRVSEIGRKFIYISPQSVGKYSETRGNFRLTVKTECQVRGSVGAAVSCETADISLSGICIRTRETFNVGDKLTVTALRIIPGGSFHELPVEVIRRREVFLDEAQYHEYGCRFLPLPPGREDMLCRDIFALQAEHLRGKRNI